MHKLALLLFSMLIFGCPFASFADEPMVSARLLVSNPAPYLGEELDLHLEVIYTGHPGERARFSWPELDNFISADLTQVLSGRGRDQHNRLVETISRRIKPLISGTILLKGAVVIVGDQRFDLQPVTLRVRPLPTAGRPKNFTDQVGTYKLVLTSNGSGPREISLNIYDSNLLSPPPKVVPWLDSGDQLIPIDTETRSAERGGREHVFRYYYSPSSGKQGSLRFTLTAYDPADQSYLDVESGPATTQVSMAIFILLAFGMIVAVSGWLLLNRHRHPRSIDGCLERICGRPTAGLSRDSILECLRPDITRSESEALQSYWDIGDAHRFSRDRSIEMQNLSALKNSLRQSLWKVIDKRQNIT